MVWKLNFKNCRVICPFPTPNLSVPQGTLGAQLGYAEALTHQFLDSSNDEDNERFHN